MNARIAIIGCGRMGRERVHAAKHAGATVCGVMDADENRLSEFSRAFELPAYTSLAELPWRNLDAVFLCTPPAYREPVIKCAVDHGVSIFVEKPLALNAAAAARLASIVENAGAIAAVGYMNRYRVGIDLAKRVAAGDDFIAMTITWAGTAYGVPWWTLHEQSGGPINEQATHLADLLRYIVGDVAQVYAVRAIDERRLAASIMFARGGVGTLCYTCEAPKKAISLEVLTTRGSLRLAGWDFKPVENTIDGRLARDERSPFIAETEHFLNAATKRAPPDAVHASFREAYKTQLLVDMFRGATTLAAGVSAV